MVYTLIVIGLGFAAYLTALARVAASLHQRGADRREMGRMAFAAVGVLMLLVAVSVFALVPA